MALVLIIDDSPTEIYALTGHLEKHGHKVCNARTAEEGLSSAKALLPDLILMDVVMPGLNGFQATRALRKEPKTATIPVIMVTTKDQESDRLWAMRQGAQAYLVKPVAETSLITALNALLSNA
jgi:twitching motility two-component system response regulator PilH